MDRRKSRSATLGGFSMVEVIVVLLTLGILTVLIMSSLQTVQAKNRDATRRTSIDNIAAKLEACYKDEKKCNKTYPTIIQLADTSPTGWTTSNLTGFNNAWLYDSSNGVIQGNPASAATQYQYTTTPTGCTGTQGDTPCQGFTLRAFQETNPEHPYVKDSLNK